MYILSKILNQVKFYQKEVFLGLCIVLISVISFNLGSINALNKTPISIKGSSDKANIFDAVNSKSEILNSKQTQNSKFQSLKSDPRVVASKASTTKKYHYSWCASGKRITQKNQLWFENESLAQQAGYTLAGNCQ